MTHFLIVLDRLKGMNLSDDVLEAANVTTVNEKVLHVFQPLRRFWVFENERDQGVPNLLGAHPLDRPAL